MEPRHSGDVLGGDHSANKAEGLIGRWRARLRLAGLKWKAVCAEHRAAVAINGASSSFEAALERVLLAAIARVEADQARMVPGRLPTLPRRD
jgi:hypothetical protein